MKRIILTVLTSVALVLGTMSAANAQIVYINDGDNPNPAVYGDISRVQLDHAPRNVFTKVRYQGEYGRHQQYGQPAEYLKIFYDTNPGRPGPEFVLEVTILTQYYNVVDSWYLQRIDGWTGERTQRRCRNARASTTRIGATYVKVPRWCLRTGGNQRPAKVRVSVKSQTSGFGRDDGKQFHDWAPGPRKFGPWARRA